MNIYAIIGIAALLNNVPYGVLYGVCIGESNLKPNAYVRHDCDSTRRRCTKKDPPAIGLCQLHLDTARDVGFTGKKKELFDPNINAYYASKYLSVKYKKYHSWRKAISAYNAGHPIRGNKKYVDKVIKHGKEAEPSCPL